MNDKHDTTGTPEDQIITSLFVQAEQTRLPRECSHDEEAALQRFNAWLDNNVEEMMTEQQLRECCLALRTGQMQVDDILITTVESEIGEYRRLRDLHPAPLPPDHLTTQLYLMGWLIYEASWSLVRRIPPAFELLGGERRKESEAAATLITRLSDATRRLPWPEFAPRALGAIRAQALASSKRDTERGYDDMWNLHNESHAKYFSYRESLTSCTDPRYLLALDETRLQLALAETGGACRTAEHIISRWVEGIDKGLWTSQDEARWIQRLFRELSDAAASGEEALELVARIEHDYGLVQKVSEDRLTMVGAYRNPGIMTARALLLLVPMCTEMETLHRRPPRNYESWDDAQKDFLTRFERAYRAIERPTVNGEGNPRPLMADHRRALVQLRLNLALLAPGRSLPSQLTFDPCLDIDPLDNRAVEALSRWLAEPVDGKRRGDANVIGSATMPSYVRAVEACRDKLGAKDGYRQWRSQWLELDRYSYDSGRFTRVEQVLGPAFHASRAQYAFTMVSDSGADVEASGQVEQLEDLLVA